MRGEGTLLVPVPVGTINGHWQPLKLASTPPPMNEADVHAGASARTSRVRLGTPPGRLQGPQTRLLRVTRRENDRRDRHQTNRTFHLL